MKLNVCKEITFMDLIDKIIASVQPNVSPMRYNLKIQADDINFETVQPSSISKTLIVIRFNLLHFWPSVPSFVFAVLLKCSFTVLNGYFKFYGHFPVLKFGQNP